MLANHNVAIITGRAKAVGLAAVEGVVQAGSRHIVFQLQRNRFRYYLHFVFYDRRVQLQNGGIGIRPPVQLHAGQALGNTVLLAVAYIGLPGLQGFEGFKCFEAGKILCAHWNARYGECVQVWQLLQLLYAGRPYVGKR